MKKLYFCSHDGNPRGVFNNEKSADKWREANGTLSFVYEVAYNHNNTIISVNDIDFTDWIESISDDVGTSEFERVKADFEEIFKFTVKTED